MATRRPKVKAAPPKPATRDRPPTFRDYWNANPPGTAYPCTSKLLGRTARGGSIVVACLTPLKPNAGQRRRGTKTLREGAFSLEVPNTGTRIQRTHTQTRELTRPPRGATIFPTEEQKAVGYGKKLFADSQLPGHLPSAPGLPYPARTGSSPCLPHAAAWTALDEIARQFIFEFGRVYGRVPSVAEMVMGLQHLPVFENARKVEETCLRAWAALDDRREPKWDFSPQREAAQRRANWFNQSGRQDDPFGRNDADYEEMLSESTKKRKRSER